MVRRLLLQAEALHYQTLLSKLKGDYRVAEAMIANEKRRHGELNREQLISRIVERFERHGRVVPAAGSAMTALAQDVQSALLSGGPWWRWNPRSSRTACRIPRTSRWHY